MAAPSLPTESERIRRRGGPRHKRRPAERSNGMKRGKADAQYHRGGCPEGRARGPPSGRAARRSNPKGLIRAARTSEPVVGWTGPFGVNPPPPAAESLRNTASVDGAGRFATFRSGRHRVNFILTRPPNNRIRNRRDPPVAPWSIHDDRAERFRCFRMAGRHQAGGRPGGPGISMRQRAARVFPGRLPPPRAISLMRWAPTALPRSGGTAFPT